MNLNLQKDSKLHPNSMFQSRELLKNCLERFHQSCLSFSLKREVNFRKNPLVENLFIIYGELESLKCCVIAYNMSFNWETAIIWPFVFSDLSG